MSPGSLRYGPNTFSLAKHKVLWSDEGAEEVGFALARGDVDLEMARRYMYVSEMETIVRDGYCGDGLERE
jgi:hypothetical protein